ncbi:MAG: enoyl-CoA hydratase/isomerase family protein [Dehalococcoidia bacterium]
MNYKEITLQTSEHIAILTLNRPEARNAVTNNMMEHEIPAAIEEIRCNDDIRVAILTGAGKGFCAGGDMSMLDGIASGTAKPKPRSVVVQPLAFVAKAFESLPKPMIAAVNGAAMGAGLTLVTLCDFRIAAASAKFGSSFILRGLPPDTGLTYTLPRIVGMSKALRMMLLGDPIDAAEAQRIGLVEEVVPAEDLMPKCMALAQRLAKMSPAAVEMTKQETYIGLTNDLYTQLLVETRAMEKCLSTEDFRESIKAFMEKREPQYKGR